MRYDRLTTPVTGARERAMPQNCPFCVQSSTSSHSVKDLVWAFPHGIAILGRWQFFRGYCVLFSREHAHEPTDLKAESRDGLMAEMWWLSRAIIEVTSPRKLNYELLGNQVEHPHWHLFPRFSADPEHLKPAWIRIDREEGDPVCLPRLEGDPAERPTTISLIRTALTRMGAPSA